MNSVLRSVSDLVESSPKRPPTGRAEVLWLKGNYQCFHEFFMSPKGKDPCGWVKLRNQSTLAHEKNRIRNHRSVNSLLGSRSLRSIVGANQVTKGVKGVSKGPLPYLPLFSEAVDYPFWKDQFRRILSEEFYSREKWVFFDRISLLLSGKLLFSISGSIFSSCGSEISIGLGMEDPNRDR